MRRPAPCDAELQARGIALAADDERRVGHRAGNHAEHALAGRRRPLAVDDHSWPSWSSFQAKLWWFSTPAMICAPSSFDTRRWITS